MFKKPMKIIMVTMLLLSLITLISSEFSTSGSPTTDFPSDLPLLYVDPENITGLNPGDSFTVSAKIFNLTYANVSQCKLWHWGCPIEKGGGLTYKLGNLSGIMIDFTWDPNILDYTGHTVTIPVEDYPGGVLHKPILEVVNTVDETAGTYNLSYASYNYTHAFNGNGTVFDMTFIVIKKGTCFLHFAYSKLMQFDLDYQTEIPHYVRDGYFGRDVEVAKVEVVEKIAEGLPAWVNVTVSNLGGGTENFTLAAYYNTTENGGWEPLRIQPVPQLPLAQNEHNVINMPGISFHYGETPQEGKFVASNKTLQLWWNTTGIAKGHYRIEVNTTGVPNEENITNNVQYSENLVWVTIEDHDMLIETLEIVVPTTNPDDPTKHFEFPPPLVTGEFANINFTVLNDGTVEETGLNVTLYYVDPDGNTEILLTHKNLTQMQGDRKLFELKEWKTTGFKGNYTVGANVSIVSGEDPTNNRMNQSFWIVEPPNVNFTYTVKDIHVGDTVTFNATISAHNMPDGYITRWEWKVYKGDIKEENLKYTYDGGPIMNFTFDEWSDKWPVILNVTDNYGLFYMGYDRCQFISHTAFYVSTWDYQCRARVVMTELPAKEEAGWPLMWTYAIVLVIIIIIAVAVYALKFRKPEPE